VDTDALPQSVEALTPTWLTAALREGGVLGDAVVTGVTAETVGAGVGLLCLLNRLTLQYDRPAPGAPATLVAKIPSPDPQTRGLAGAFRFYEREVRFYRDLAPAFSLPTPRCYFSAFDAKNSDFILLLEDLAGSRLGDQLAGCSATDAALAVRQIAQTHAAWWNHPRLDALDWMPATGDPVNKAGMQLYGMARPAFVARFGDMCPPELLRVSERLEAHFCAMLDAFCAGPRTVLHGDYRLDNLFFAANPGDAPLKVIDWQIAMRGVGTYDLGYFMSQSVDIEVRRAIEQDILKLYHTTLLEHGVTDYSFDACVAHYRQTLLGCFVYPVMGGGLVELVNDRAVTLATTMMLRSATAILDWQADKLIDV